MPSITIQSIQKGQGKVRVRFGNGHTMEADLSGLRAQLQEEFAGRDGMLLHFALAMLFRRSPDLSDVSWLEGKTFNLNLASDTPITVV